jgi:hypothetical protein
LGEPHHDCVKTHQLFRQATSQDSNISACTGAVGAHKFNLDFDKHHLQCYLSRARTIADNSQWQQLNSFNIQRSQWQQLNSFNIQSSEGKSNNRRQPMTTTQQLQHSKQLISTAWKQLSNNSKTADNSSATSATADDKMSDNINTLTVNCDLFNES